MPTWVKGPRSTLAALGIFLTIVAVVCGVALLVGDDGDDRAGQQRQRAAEEHTTPGTRGERGVTTRQRVSSSALWVGYCIEAPAPGSSVTLILAVPCDEPHTAEIFARFKLSSEGGYPSTAAVQARADARCQAEVGSYIGGQPSGDLVISSFAPSKEMWDDGDYSVVCALMHADGRSTTRSLEGGVA